jgi:hypothetical protein
MGHGGQQDKDKERHRIAQKFHTFTRLDFFPAYTDLFLLKIRSADGKDTP